MNIEVTLLVNITLNHPVGLRELKTHVRQAIESWGGGLHPDDPLFDGVKIAKVKLVKE